MSADTSERFVRFTFPVGGSPFDPPPHERYGVSNPQPAQPSKSQPAPPSKSQSTRQAPVAPPPTPKPATIARVHISKMTPKMFDREFRQPGVPVVITGALDQIPAEAWKLHNFIALFDEEATYQCRIHGGDKFATTPDAWRGKSHARHVVATTPRKFADSITSGIAAREDCYVQADIQASRAGQALSPPLDLLGERCGLRLHQQYMGIVNMWWGASGHTEPLHMDVTDGTLFQLRGRKRIVLFPPQHWCDLYPFPSSPQGMSWAFAQVVQSQPDYERFPRLRDAMPHRIEVVLDEGEVLFIPACCAHEISGEPTLEDGTPVEHVLSVNRFWRTDPKLVRKHMPQDALPSYNATMAFD
jgi:hypothetical protein